MLYDFGFWIFIIIDTCMEDYLHEFLTGSVLQIIQTGVTVEFLHGNNKFNFICITIPILPDNIFSCIKWEYNQDFNFNKTVGFFIVFKIYQHSLKMWIIFSWSLIHAKMYIAHTWDQKIYCNLIILFYPTHAHWMK